MRMEPSVTTRIEELTRQQQQLPAVTSSCAIPPVIISLSSQAPLAVAATPIAAPLVGKNKNVLKERFILKNCPTEALLRLKVRIFIVSRPVSNTGAVGLIFSLLLLLAYPLNPLVINVHTAYCSWAPLTENLAGEKR